MASRIAPLESTPEWLLDLLPVPVVIIRGGEYLYVNAAFADLVGLRRDELIGRPVRERVHPDDRDEIPNDIVDASSARPFVTQLRVKRGDGAEHSILLNAVDFTYGGDRAVLATCQDVTLQADALSIAVRMAALGRLAGGVAHDFNNLLLVVGGHIERLREALPQGHQLRSSIDAIADEAQRAARLTDRLLSFGRGQLLALESVDFGVFIEELATPLRAALGPTIDVRVDPAAQGAVISADRLRLREMLWHLIDNAREAMPDGGTLTLAVDAVVVDEQMQSRWAFLPAGRSFVRLRVSDSGSGMASDVVPHVFEPFFTTKGRGRGAGLGLASVYGLVKQSAGYVFVERTGPDGTCVAVLWPHAVSSKSVAPTKPSPAAAAHRVGARILLVEDDEGVRELLLDVLLSGGFEVDAAESAERAIDLATKAPVDLLLSDIDLPGMNGAQLAAQLRNRQPTLRVILMSGYPDDGAIERAGLRERPILMRKPFATAALLEQVRAALTTDILPQ